MLKLSVGILCMLGETARANECQLWNYDGFDCVLLRDSYINMCYCVCRWVGDFVFCLCDFVFVCGQGEGLLKNEDS